MMCWIGTGLKTLKSGHGIEILLMIRGWYILYKYKTRKDVQIRWTLFLRNSDFFFLFTDVSGQLINT